MVDMKDYMNLRVSRFSEELKEPRNSSPNDRPVLFLNPPAVRHPQLLRSSDPTNSARLKIKRGRDAMPPSSRVSSLGSFRAMSSSVKRIRVPLFGGTLTVPKHTKAEAAAIRSGGGSASALEVNADGELLMTPNDIDGLEQWLVSPRSPQGTSFAERVASGMAAYGIEPRKSSQQRRPSSAVSKGGESPGASKSLAGGGAAADLLAPSVQEQAARMDRERQAARATRTFPASPVRPMSAHGRLSVGKKHLQDPDTRGHRALSPNSSRLDPASREGGGGDGGGHQQLYPNSARLEGGGGDGSRWENP
ncbi:hypothetical protein T484DRAFT_1890941, partial [Baffinella frigidus]